MSLQYYAQSIYMCAHCGGGLAFQSGQKLPSGDLQAILKCIVPNCPQFDQPMRITLMPIQAARVTE